MTPRGAIVGAAGLVALACGGAGGGGAGGGGARAGGDATAGRSPVAQVAAGDSAPLSVRYDQHVFAGGVAPPGAVLANPFRGDANSVSEGKALFRTMNCDGCHGGAADGWVGPSLIDGRWRYGGAEGPVFQSIYYGRPEGMPAYGGVLTPPVTWKIVTYLRSLPPPKSVPTQVW